MLQKFSAIRYLITYTYSIHGHISIDKSLKSQALCKVIAATLIASIGIIVQLYYIVKTYHIAQNFAGGKVR